MKAVNILEDGIPRDISQISKLRHFVFRQTYSKSDHQNFPLAIIQFGRRVQVLIYYSFFIYKKTCFKYTSISSLAIEIHIQPSQNLLAAGHLAYV